MVSDSFCLKSCAKYLKYWVASACTVAPLAEVHVLFMVMRVIKFTTFMANTMGVGPGLLHTLDCTNLLVMALGGVGDA